MLEEKPWNLEAVSRLFLGIMTTFFVGAVLGGLAGHFTTGWTKAQTDFLQIVIGFSFSEIPALIWIGWFLRREHVSWRDAFGFNLNEPVRAAAYGILAGVLFAPAAWGLETGSAYAMKWVHLKAEEQDMVQELEQGGLTTPEKAFLGVVAVVLAPMVEEMFFRGILYPAIKRTGHRQVALWATSTLFALAHFNMVTFLPLLVFSLLLIYLYETFGNLLAPMAAHSLFNAFNFVWLVFPKLSQALGLTS